MNGWGGCTWTPLSSRTIAQRKVVKICDPIPKTMVHEMSLLTRSKCSHLFGAHIQNNLIFTCFAESYLQKLKQIQKYENSSLTVGYLANL